MTSFYLRNQRNFFCRHDDDTVDDDVIISFTSISFTDFDLLTTLMRVASAANLFCYCISDSEKCKNI